MLVCSISVVLICNPCQRFLALLLEGQEGPRKSKSQARSSRRVSCPTRNLLCFEFKESLPKTNKQNTTLRPLCQDGKLMAQSWWQSPGSIPRSDGAADLGEMLGHKPVRRDEVRWKKQIPAGGKPSGSSCLALSLLLASWLIGVAQSRRKCLQNR